MRFLSDEASFQRPIKEVKFHIIRLDGIRTHLFLQGLDPVKHGPAWYRTHRSTETALTVMRFLIFSSVTASSFMLLEWFSHWNINIYSQSDMFLTTFVQNNLSFIQPNNKCFDPLQYKQSTGRGIPRNWKTDMTKICSWMRCTVSLFRNPCTVMLKCTYTVPTRNVVDPD